MMRTRALEDLAVFHSVPAFAAPLHVCQPESFFENFSLPV
jgi:hypothetical protein